MANSDSYQRFIVIGTARTGSTLLWSYLNSHPDILCLRGVYGSVHKINFGKFYNELPEEYHSPKLVKQRNTDPIKFLQNYIFKPYSKPYKAVGFKYFYNHDEHLQNKNELIAYFTTNTDIKFIHIKRKNLLASLFSYKRALAEQKWMNAEPDYQTKLSISECEKYFKTIIKDQVRFENLFGERSFQIIYDNLISQQREILNEMQQFIGVTPLALSTEMRKNKSKKLSRAITNYNELKQYFKKSEYKKYFE